MRSVAAVTLTLTLAGLCGLPTLTDASVPVQLLPFINYYEVYLEPYSDLTQKLRGPNSYTATLAMLGLVMAGTLGYLPVNLKDVANAIDNRRNGRRRRYRSRGYPAVEALSRRGGGPAASRRHHRRWRRDLAGPDPDTLRQLLVSVDGDGCLARLICEAEAAGPQERRLVREDLLHRLIRSGVGPVRPSAEWGAAGRDSRRPDQPLPDCHLLSALCPNSPLEALRRARGHRSLQEVGHEEVAGNQ